MLSKRLIGPYEGVSRYAGVSTEQTTGRLHYNENLFGPSPKVMDTLKDLTMEDLYLYESNEKDDLIECLSADLGIPSKYIFLNNGSSENIRAILSVIPERGDTILLPDPCWSYYTGLVTYKFLNPVTYPILEEGDKCAHDVAAIHEMAKKYNPKVIMITTPAMPTGNVISDEDLEDIIRSYPDSLVVVDEAYLGFAHYTRDVLHLIETYDNVVFSRTFSKFFGLANLRIGYGMCGTALKKILWLDMPLHCVSRFSKRMAIAAFMDKEYYATITKELNEAKREFIDTLNQIEGVKAFESDSNFVYIRVAGYDAEKIKQTCQDKGFLFRIFVNNNEKHLRITMASKAIVHDLLDVLVPAIKDSKI